MRRRSVAVCNRGRECGRTCIKKKWNCYTAPASRKGVKARGTRKPRRLGDIVVDNLYIITADGRQPTKNPWAAAERRSGLTYKWVNLGNGEWTRRSVRR